MKAIWQRGGGSQDSKNGRPSRAGRTHGHVRSTGTVTILLCLLATLLVKAYLLGCVSISGDEFHYLSSVYAFERGDLAQPLEHFHVHFFRWLHAVGENEVTQVIVARVVMFAFFLGTCTCLYLLGRHLLGPSGALFSTVCYTGHLFSMAEGASFRHDTPAIFFIMLAAYHFIARAKSVGSNVCAGLALAVACLFTIKTSIYFTVFAALVCVRLLASDDRRAAMKRSFCFAGSLAAAFVVLFVLHRSALARSPSGGASLTGVLGRAFSTFITFDRPASRLETLYTTLWFDHFTWLLLGLGLVVCLHRLLKRGCRWDAPEGYLIALALPLLSLVFYRNTGAYFYVFMLASPILLCGYGFGLIRTWMIRTGPRMAAIGVVVLGLVAAKNSALCPWLVGPWTARKAVQQDLLTHIHRMFGEPVPYIDTFGMVASFPKVGFFMSSAGLKVYRAEGEPVLKKSLVEQNPVFLLAYARYLDLHFNRPPESAHGFTLFQEDWTALKSHFIHHWGPIWVAGKQFQPGPEKQRQAFEILTPGPYTVETDTEILIDGSACHHGDVIRLEYGMHAIEVGRGDGTITLRWGDGLYRPSAEPSSIPLFPGKLG